MSKLKEFRPIRSEQMTMDLPNEVDPRQQIIV